MTEVLNGYGVSLVERPPIEKRTRQLLLEEINSEWKTTSDLITAIEKKKNIYIGMEWALHVLLDALLKEGRVGQATFWGSVSSWWNNQPLSCPQCRTSEVDQFFTESGTLIHNHCVNCHKWGGLERSRGPVKGEQPGMLGVPGKVHVQKRPYKIGQEELEDYGKYRRQMLIDYDKKYSLEQLKEMCRAKGYSVSGDKKTLIGRLI